MTAINCPLVTKEGFRKLGCIALPRVRTVGCVHTWTWSTTTGRRIGPDQVSLSEHEDVSGAKKSCRVADP